MQSARSATRSTGTTRPTGRRRSIAWRCGASTRRSPSSSVGRSSSRGRCTRRWDSPMQRSTNSYLVRSLHAKYSVCSRLLLFLVPEHQHAQQGARSPALYRSQLPPAGPSFLPWNRMGNMQGWGGPTPPEFWQRTAALEVQLLAMMRAYGMTPVLPGESTTLRRDCCHSSSGLSCANISSAFPTSSLSSLQASPATSHQRCSASSPTLTTHSRRTGQIFPPPTVL